MSSDIRLAFAHPSERAEATATRDHLQPHLGQEHLGFIILKLADLFFDPG